MTQNLLQTSTLVITLAALAFVPGCDAPDDGTDGIEDDRKGGKNGGDNDPDINALAIEVRELAADKGIGVMPAAPSVPGKLYQLGRMLAFDKELSGNRDISCMSCHVPRLATGDDLTLSIGQGASGLGDDRVHPNGEFIARNAPPLFNLHMMNDLFWDGRVSVHGNNIQTPAGSQITNEMKQVFQFGAISVLPLFPVTSREEMRAFSGNELAAIPDSNFQGIWAGVMARLGQIPEYRTMFEQAYPGTSFDDMTFAHASNAIGGYIVQAFEMKASKWDQLLAGDNEALTLTQLKGAKNFLSAKCSICHSGANLSDGDFHNIALAQFGPGTGGGDDFGRFNVTGSAAQRYAFRSTPLRNVELSGPYGHAGQFESLLDFVDRYSESDIKLLDYDVSQVHPLLQSTLVDNFDDILDTRDPLLVGVVFDEQTIAEVAEFMNALTDQKALTLPAQVVPNSVPSGLSIDK